MSASRYESRKLSQLLPELAPLAATVSVSDITLDSRAVRPGSLFLACPGRRTHGLKHLQAALAQGASAVVYEPADGLEIPAGAADVLVAAVPDLGRRIGEIADEFFGRPSAAMAVSGITGTNGKSTCAWMLANALRRCGRPAGYIGTLGVGLASADGKFSPVTHTTADAVTVHRQLHELRRAGAQCVAMEVSSHALDQHRIDAVRLRVAGYTNLTRDHLDYHGSMAAYGAAKARLLDWCGLDSRVINIDDGFGMQLAARTASAGRLFVTTRQAASASAARRFATAGATVLSAEAIQLDTAGLRCEIVLNGRRSGLRSHLIGEFNVDNLLTALGMLLALQVPEAQALRALLDCRAPPGRMEMFGGESLPLVLVDYAHTPDALSKALQAARRHCAGKLRVVFGCGGDRDAGKRPQMAVAAARCADEILLTDDNPRSERPESIVADIVTGLPAGVAHRVVHDRAAAITEAINHSRSGDVVLIAGKGHEDYQIYGSERRAFSDQLVVRAALGVAA